MSKLKKYRMTNYGRIRAGKYVRLIYEVVPSAVEANEEGLIFVKAVVDKNTLDRGNEFESKKAALLYVAENNLRLIDEFDFTL